MTDIELHKTVNFMNILTITVLYSNKKDEK